MRYKILYISPQIFINFAIRGVDGSIKVVSGALPEDSKYVRAFTDDNTGFGRIGLVIESESFDLLKDGDKIPTVDPVFDKVQ